jgi:glycosyltransferase involved in cell wall biosynthesis
VRKPHHLVPEVGGAPPGRLAAVVPATNAPPTLERCVASIRAILAENEELYVIDEPSSAGPSRARNIGASLASGDILVFVDSDVEVHADAFDRIRSAFSDDPELSAVFGSYDSEPHPHGLISDFRNLLHHHVHTRGAGSATTFWAGLGAVRREAFHSVGGFDAGRFPRASVEDIEFGMRLSSAGARIVLDPRIQGKHLKRWTLANMVRTDLLRRGAPWVRLLLERGSSSNALNLGWRQRASVVVSLLFVTAVAVRRPGVAATGAVTLVVLNRSFYRLLARQGGWRLAVAGPPLHLVHHLVSAAAVPLGVASYLHAQRRR